MTEPEWDIEPAANPIRVGDTDIYLDRNYVENKAAWYVLMRKCGGWLDRELLLQ